MCTDSYSGEDLLWSNSVVSLGTFWAETKWFSLLVLSIPGDGSSLSTIIPMTHVDIATSPCLSKHSLGFLVGWLVGFGVTGN